MLLVHMYNSFLKISKIILKRSKIVFNNVINIINIINNINRLLCDGYH